MIYLKVQKDKKTIEFILRTIIVIIIIIIIV